MKRMKGLIRMKCLLLEALNLTVGNGYRAFIPCIPGGLAYFESDE
jgi:hypothetical protein